MSNVQLENGYCSLATELVDQFCRYRLSGEEWLVLWAIFRKTYCWHKKEDKIALSTFAQMTGLKRPTVLRALHKLLSKKIIDIIKKDDRQPNTYRFNKHFDTWLSLSKKDTLSSKKIMPVINKDNELSSKKRHSIDIKDTSSKDKSVKEKSFTPKIKIMKDEYPLEELSYETVDAPKGKSKYGSKTMAMLARKFAEVAEIPIGATFDASEWAKPLGELYRRFNKDPDKTMKFIEDAGRYFNGISRTFTPHTLVKDFTMLKSKWLTQSTNDPRFE